MYGFSPLRTHNTFFVIFNASSALYTCVFVQNSIVAKYIFEIFLSKETKERVNEKLSKNW